MHLGPLLLSCDDASVQRPQPALSRPQADLTGSCPDGFCARVENKNSGHLFEYGADHNCTNGGKLLNGILIMDAVPNA